MESAKKLSEMADSYMKMADQEYDALYEITKYSTNTKLKDQTVIDACYIKTPFREESPLNPEDDFGLMIACDGYSFRKGLVEFWLMIVQENVKFITGFNEEYKRGGYADYGGFYSVYKYFPHDTEDQFEIDELFIIKTVKTTKTDQMVIRMLEVFDTQTGEKVHEVKHIHFLAWEDFEVPSQEDTGELMTILQEQADMLMEQIELMRQDKTKNP